MAVELNDDERMAFVTAAHTGVLTTLQADGSPVSVPMWFVCIGDHVYMRTRARTPKVDNIVRDARVCFVTEDGLGWGELRAVIVRGRAALVDDVVERRRAIDAIDAKYASYGAARQRFTEGTSRHYGGEVAVIRIAVDPRSTTSWDNRKVRLREVNVAAHESGRSNGE